LGWDHAQEVIMALVQERAIHITATDLPIMAVFTQEVIMDIIMEAGEVIVAEDMADTMAEDIMADMPVETGVAIMEDMEAIDNDPKKNKKSSFAALFILIYKN
jgi:hypothetical protein